MAKVLLIDDDKDQLELRALILSHKGHEVESASNCQQALACIQDFAPDVILTDLLLPTAADGEAVIRAIRAQRPGAKIVVMSGYAGGIDVPADAVLRKPVRTEKLLATLARLAMGVCLFLARGAEFPFTTTSQESEVTAELRARGPAGQLVELRVDDAPPFHVNLYAGESERVYPVFLGRWRAGAHSLSVSNSGGGSVAVQAIHEIRRSDELYDVVANAPVLFARPNTIGKFTDIPLLAYATRDSDAGQKVLEYTIVFSNEDGGTSTRNLMARWGRATDIEYIYRVWLNADGSPARAIIQGKDHKDIEYAGKRFGWHPLLTPVTDNNMVNFDRDSPVRYQLAPRLADLSRHSREIVMDEDPFTYRFSAEELRREGKLRPYGTEEGEKISDPRNYLVIEAKLSIENAGLQVLVRCHGETRWLGGALGMAENFINRSGWIRTAIELPPGARPEAIAFQCLTPKRAGACRVDALGKVFKLTEDYVPGPNLAPALAPVGRPFKIFTAPEGSRPAPNGFRSGGILPDMSIQSPGARNRHVIRRRFIQTVLQKAPQAQTVGHSPRDAAFAANAFEEPNQQEPEVYARSHRRPPQLGMVELRAHPLAEWIEPGCLQHPVQRFIGRMSGSFDLFARVEQPFLLLPISLGPHRHAQL